MRSALHCCEVPKECHIWLRFYCFFLALCGKRLMYSCLMPRETDICWQLVFYMCICFYSIKSVYLVNTYVEAFIFTKHIERWSTV
ncbi:hypothetical protein V5799_022405 [Amblyomma americanum]|uniref:Uncharacterized protein n=1 Tax=Amblyomma americanum TaxID=6943 RepID=A0AAQ4FL31_AMBAM